MLLSDLANFVGGKIGMTDTTTLTKIKTWAKQRHDGLCASALWKDMLTVYRFAVIAGQQDVILPPQVAHVCGAKYDDTGRIEAVDAAFIFASNPEIWDNSGEPANYTQPAAIATKAMPATAGEKLRFVSSNSGDTTKKVTIYGEDSTGAAVTEQVTLNGTSTVDSVNSYCVVYGLSKETTAGTVTVTGKDSGTALQTLTATQDQKLHPRVRLHPIPTVAITLSVLGKRHAPPLVNDTDATALPLLDPALLALVQGDALEWMNQYGKAQLKFTEGNGLLEGAKLNAVYQPAQTHQVVAADSLGEGCSPDSFL